MRNRFVNKSDCIFNIAFVQHFYCRVHIPERIDINAEGQPSLAYANESVSVRY